MEIKENDEMAKKKGKGKKASKQQLAAFDVYQQSDDALVVLHSGDTPDNENVDFIETVDAVDERDAIRQVKKSHKDLKHASVANPDHDPDTNDDVRKEAERSTNERLRISPKKSGGRKKSAAKSSVKKKTAKKTAKKKRAKSRR
jgi:hypothetical protein